MPSDSFTDRAGGGQSGSSWDNTSSVSGGGMDRMREEATRQGSAALNSLKEGARSVGEEARDRASGYVEGSKEAITDSLEAFAQAIRRASDELSERDQTMAAQLIRQGASTLERVTRSIEGTSLEDMIRQVRNFARNNPTAFIGGTMLVGFAMARFARASSRSGSGGYAGQAWSGDDRGYAGSEEWSSGGGSAGAGSYGSGAGGAGSYGSGGGTYGSGSGSSGSYGSGAGGSGSYGSGAGGYGSTGTGGSSSYGAGGASGGGSSYGSTGAGGLGSSYPSNTGGAGDVPPGSQGYAGGGMGTDPIQSSGPSSETDDSMTGGSGSSGGLGSSSISTGGNR